MPQQWSGRSRGSKTGYAVFIFLIRYLGIRQAYFLLRPVALYYLLFVPEARRPVQYLYRERLKFGYFKTIKLLNRNFFVFGQTLIDKFAVLTGSYRHFKVSRTGAQYLHTLIEGGEGGILVSAHLGNWALAGHLLQHLDTVVHVVMYDGEDRQLKQYLAQQTAVKTFRIIFIREDLSHIYEIAAALNRNELVCIHADRFLEKNRTIFHSFLGEIAEFPLGPFALAVKLKAPVCFVFAVKESKFHYHFYGFPPKIYQGRGMEGINLMLSDFVNLLEQQVKLHPEQWFNYYPFWKVRPPG
ncbi:MAG TPA: lipid A biosynthesis acyltransferase [Edaphocola sp.]|nr:lipid A biosynthesis acyltransferase [Edaphocola sp.]